MSDGTGGRRRIVLDTALDPGAAPESAAALEVAGFHGAWVTETVRDPYLYLSAAADATSTMSLGTGVAIAAAESRDVTFEANLAIWLEGTSAVSALLADRDWSTALAAVAPVTDTEGSLVLSVRENVLQAASALS